MTISNRALAVSLSLILIAVLSSTAIAQQKAKQVEFFRYGKGVAYNLVYDRLMSENEAYRNGIGRPPSHTIATADLNNDKTPEIIVRIDDEYGGFCDEYYFCDTRIYVYQDTGLIEIAKFTGSSDIRILDTTTKDVKNFLVKRLDKKYDLYKWGGDRYQKVTTP